MAAAPETAARLDPAVTLFMALQETERCLALTRTAIRDTTARLANANASINRTFHDMGWDRTAPVPVPARRRSPAAAARRSAPAQSPPTATRRPARPRARPDRSSSPDR